MIVIDSGLNCPIAVDKTNWLNNDDNGDIYSIAETGSQITVTRTDKTSSANLHRGWGNDLKFECCSDDGNFYLNTLISIKS